MEFKPVMQGYDSCLHDESRLEGFADYIAFPEDTAQAAEAVRKAAAEGLSVTVQGARTGIAGGAVPAGGLILCAERMNRTAGFETDASGGRILRVQAGITFAELNSFLLREMPGYRFAPNPTEPSASLGGAFACSAKGPNSLRYGGTGAHVQALSWITPRGEIWDIPRGSYRFDAGGCPLPDGSRLDIDTNVPAGACAFLHPAAGLDLADFLAGSEGLAGMAGELSLRLERQPAVSWAVVYFFRAEDRAADFARSLAHWKDSSSGGACLSAAEYYDSASLELLRQGREQATGLRHFPSVGNEYREALHVELEGDSPDGIEAALMEQLALFAESGGKDEDTWAASDRAEMEKYQSLRHGVPELINTEVSRIQLLLPGFCKTAADNMTQPEQAASWIKRYHRDIAEAGLRGFVFGHILEGRLHVNLLAEDEAGFRRCRALMESWAASIREEGGVLAAENGIGRLKAPLVSRFLSKERLEQIRRILQCLDPQGTMGGFERFGGGL